MLSLLFGSIILLVIIAVSLTVGFVLGVKSLVLSLKKQPTGSTVEEYLKEVKLSK